MKLKLKNFFRIGVKDSKTISEKTILALKKKIQKICPYSVVRLYPKKYNELYGNFRNLNRLLAWGHATAIAELVEKTGCKNVTIDQFASEDVVENALKQKKIETNLTQRHKGEADPVVAAASILARAAFVEGIAKLGDEVGMVLPKGASAQVTVAGKALVSKHGAHILETVAKLHFKTGERF